MYQGNLYDGLLLFYVLKLYLAAGSEAKAEARHRPVMRASKPTFTKWFLAKMGQVLVTVGTRLQKQPPLPYGVSAAERI
ncbi:MAG: hypothetical protein JW953_11575 [Anaerolineae bacterium]|nr:hypothetical protein [Anaerolineae bacterium]